MIDRRITRRALLAAAVAVTVLGTGGAAAAGVHGDGHDRRDREVAVATYNVDFGTDLAPLFVLPADKLVAGARAAYDGMLASDYAGRADTLARLLAREAPDVIGLQEVALWQTLDLTTPNATWTTTNDYRARLLAALERRGAHYRVVVANTTFRAQLPIAATAAGPTLLAQFTDQNLILVRRGAGIDVTNPQEGQFVTGIPLPAPLSLKVTRGWAAADLTVRGIAFRFVTTHLEAYTAIPSDTQKEYFRNLQTKELLTGAVVAASPLPVVITGDINSRPTCTGVNTAAYGMIVAAGFTEVWPATHRTDPCGGFTSGNRDVRTATGIVDHRIDDVFFPATALRAVEARVVGVTETTAAGMWISDHAGTVATLALPEHDRGDHGDGGDHGDHGDGGRH